MNIDLSASIVGVSLVLKVTGCTVLVYWLCLWAGTWKFYWKAVDANGPTRSWVWTRSSKHKVCVSSILSTNLIYVCVPPFLSLCDYNLALCGVVDVAGCAGTLMTAALFPCLVIRFLSRRSHTWNRWSLEVYGYIWFGCDGSRLEKGDTV